MTKIHDKEKCANIKKIEPFQYFIIILAILGLGTLMATIFMVLWFSGERLGLFQYLSVCQIEGLTEGENWILFVATFILTFFIILLVIWFIYRGYRKWQCSDFDKTVENKLIH